MNFGKNLQHDFPKMRGGSMDVWNYSENSSVFEGLGFPKGQHHGPDRLLRVELLQIGDKIFIFFWRKWTFPAKD